MSIGNEYLWQLTKYEQDDYEYDFIPRMSRTNVGMTTYQLTKYDQEDHEYDYCPSMSRTSMNILMTKYDH
jgi:hypothetical protein